MSKTKESVSGVLKGEMTQYIPLHLITTSHNPRKPLKKLQEIGFDPMNFCHDFGLSEDEEKKKHFCKTIEENHPEIVLMAASLRDRTQIQPVIVRDFRTKEGDEYETHYGIACGERRFISCVYRQASTGEPCPIRAEVRKLTVREAYWLGVDENLIREDMSEVEKGLIFANYADENKDEAGSPLPMTEVAKHFHVEYQYARGRAALATKLPEERLKLYSEGKLNLTDAIREALGEPSHRSRPPREGRRNPLTMKQLEALFDTTLRTNTVRLDTLAEVMKIDLDTALVESDNRITAKEEMEARGIEQAAKNEE